MKTPKTAGGRDQRVPASTSRREFVAMSAAAAGLLAAAGSTQAAESSILERDVVIHTSDGDCDAAFFYPAQGMYPGVLIWPDIFGLRPAFRDFGRRLAAQGYSVLVPNLFYRSAKAPIYSDVSSISFQDPATRAKMDQLTAPLGAPGAIEGDAHAFIAFLDAQRQVDKAKKIGTQGYCMSGPLAMKTAAVISDRVGACATFHGGGLVTDKSDSPHLLAPKIRARMYIAIAASDDARQPDAKDKLREAFAAAKVVAEVEVYPGTLHGWCVPDMPARDGAPTYNRPGAERAWAKLLALYKAVLA
ncbi:MAG TPA: dienelactone hydrolase family protein [Steroidobacteraceae bacterium]